MSPTITKDNVLYLKPGPELDSAVTECVLNECAHFLERKTTGDMFKKTTLLQCRKCGITFFDSPLPEGLHVKPYSTDGSINAPIWDIVRRYDDLVLKKQGHTYLCKLTHQGNHVKSFAPNLTESVCKTLILWHLQYGKV